MVVWEECQDFVPQKVMHDSARMVGAVEKLVKQGRNHGVGTTLISQRPQAVNKDVLNQTECLIVLQTTGPQERKTIAGWVVENAKEVADAVDELPKLSRGEAFVWSPQWLKTFKKIRIGKKWTYDASSTPEFGEAADARQLVPVDLDAIHAAMQEQLERQEAEDPTALRAELAKVRRELEQAKKRTPAAAAAPLKLERVEVPMLTEKDVQRFEAACARMQKKLDEHLRELAPLQERLTAASHEILAKMSAAMKQARIPLPTQAPTASQTPAPRRARSARSADGSTDGALPVGERAVLEALIQFADGLRPEQITVLTTYKRSTRNTYIARLRERGYVESDGDRVRATAAGRAALPDAQPLPTGSALRDHWRTRLPAGEWAILDVLIRAYPKVITRDEIDGETGFKRSTRNSYISRLEAKELVVDAGYGQVRAHEMLFD